MLYIFNGTTTPGGSGTLIIEISRSHSCRHSTLGMTPLYEWSSHCRDYLTTERNIHFLGGIRTHSPGKRASADPRLRSRGRWDRLLAALQKKSIFLGFPEVESSKLLRNAGTYIPGVHKFSRNPAATSKVLVATRGTWVKFHSKHPFILGATVK
jgi:hypothetical protein